VPCPDLSMRSIRRPYSITSSARASSVGGTSRPSVLAVFGCYGASGDEIASIGKLLTERWLHRRRCIALWHFVHRGVVPEGVVLRPAH
jgi:hypothetical protein